MRVALLTLFIAACGTAPDAADVYPAVEPAVEATAEPAAQPATAGARINVNIADEATLKGIPGMTERMAHEFVEYRPYVSISQFRAEIGKYADEATVAGYEQHIYVPIEYNDCDAATLMQIPGVDSAIAEQLIAGRPFSSAAEFTMMTEGVASSDSRIAAAAMLVSQ
ncbi:MAG: DNA uptake protein ComE-like DNA-binding protein [Myxococcota bacterium]|jgi:DNA uptake protein ComE-like DNA-binding protein